MIFQNGIMALCLLHGSVAFAIDSFSTYERAALYHDHAGQQFSVAKAILDRLALKGDESILEIGCRGGKVAAHLAGRLNEGEVVGVEMRGDGAIEFARKNYSQELYPNLSFLVGDFLQSDFYPHFDLAVSFSSLHWFEDQGAILDKVYESMLSGGKLIFTIPAKPKDEITAILYSVMQDKRWSSYFANYTHPRRKFTPEEYTTFLEAAGFKDIRVEIETFHYGFENKRALIDWFRAFSPVLDVLPYERVEKEFLTDFANKYVEILPVGEDGLIPFIQDELIIHATKE